MQLQGILKAAERFITNNTPGILTGIGVAGAVTTAVLTGKASYRSALMIAEANIPFERGDAPEPTTRDKAELVWKEFIPPAIVGVATITAIIAANRVGSTRAAALAAAFKVSEKMAEEYKQKVVETIGKNGEEKIRQQVAQEHLERVPIPQTIIITGPECIFIDRFSGRTFKSDMESVRKAVNRVNHQVNNCFYASLTDFYDALGLEKTAVSDEFGWNTDELLDVTFTAVMTQDDRPAIAMEYNKTPIRNYDRVQ